MASASVKPDVVDVPPENLLCVICSEYYKQAKVLPCLHRYCQHCLETLIEKNGGKLVCPVCRRTHTTPTGGVPAIPDDLFINSVVAKTFHHGTNKTGSELCEGCTQKSTANRCLDCGVNICENCSIAHKKFPATSRHNLLAIEEYKVRKLNNPTAVQSPVYCSTHPDKLVELYCDSCDDVICFQCTAFEHDKPKHIYREITSSAEVYNTELGDRVETLKRNKGDAVLSRETIRGVAAQLEAGFQEERGKVEQHATDMIIKLTRRINEKKEFLVKALQSEYKKRQQNLESQVKDLTNVIDDLNYVIDLGENMMSQASPAQLMHAKKRMNSHISLLLKHKMQCTPSEHHYLGFDASDDFSADRQLGEIRMTPKCEIRMVTKRRIVGDEISLKVVPLSTDKPVDFEVYLEGVLIKPDSNTEVMTLLKNDDGTLTLTTRARIEGKHQIIVCVNKKEIEGSPVTAWVLPSADLIQRLAGKGARVDDLKSPHGIVRSGKGSYFVCDMENKRLHSIYDEKHNNPKAFVVKVPSQPSDNQQSNQPSDNQQYQERPSPQVTPADTQQPDNQQQASPQEMSGYTQRSDTNQSRYSYRGRNRRRGRDMVQLQGSMPVDPSKPSPINPSFKDTYPCCVAMLSENQIYFTDSFLPDNKQVVVCDKYGKFIRCFGSDRMKYPVGIALSRTKGRAYVVDNNGHCVHIYSLFGVWLSTFGSCGDGPGQLCYPNCIAINSEGNLYISDKDNHRIQVYSEDGEYLFHFGSKGGGDGQLHCPFGLTTDAEDNVYVCDSGNSRVVKFSSRGHYISRVDRYEHGLKYPVGVCVTDDQPFPKVIVTDKDENTVVSFTQ